MQEENYPRLIRFPVRGAGDIGYLAIAEQTGELPFEIKRVFWTYYTPQNITRGRHAHHQTQMIIIAVHGKIVLSTESPDGSTQQFTLDNPEAGVYIPALTWHQMVYSHDAVQLVLASTPYDPADYIRDYQQFKSL